MTFICLKLNHENLTESSIIGNYFNSMYEGNGFIWTTCATVWYTWEPSMVNLNNKVKHGLT